MTSEKGFLKFNFTWLKTESIDKGLIESLNVWRDKLYTLKLIGAYPNGIGYGNISTRLSDNKFLISGSSTGIFEHLTGDHYTRVTEYNFEQNKLTCEGPIQASSESLTHAAVYESCKYAKAVIHIHNKPMWERLINKIPTSSIDVEYGTPEMAYEIHRLFRDTDLETKRILVMGGHEEGIISFGKDLDEAGKVILEHYNFKV